jgi:hypothetical protein
LELFPRQTTATNSTHPAYFYSLQYTTKLLPLPPYAHFPPGLSKLQV